MKEAGAGAEPEVVKPVGVEEGAQSGEDSAVSGGQEVDPTTESNAETRPEGASLEDENIGSDQSAQQEAPVTGQAPDTVDAPQNGGGVYIVALFFWWFALDVLLWCDMVDFKRTRTNTYVVTPFIMVLPDI